MISQLPLRLLRGYVGCSIVVFIAVQTLKHFGVASPKWVFSHLNDFIVLPLVATLGLHAVWFLKRDTTIRLSIVTILSLVLLFSIVFEYYLPQQSHRYTADILDVVAYSLGGVVFYLLQKFK
ncbi:hypothetical protein BXY82_1791 [Gelidibacter sediminis]|uniref:VanZ like protein n=1 Tax=Gelidibacter sediminis TaxID=1608710 RepID=A0A4R7Q003_9FLAO|nr:hypothetical protein [Gelidibacter sediminis]TDU39761.1 hypothetical protein BXY82_1791 [Gelidibacter sediminis]